MGSTFFAPKGVDYSREGVYSREAIIAPAGISPRRRNPDRGGTLARILRKVLTVEIYSHTVNIDKISICLNRGREESVGNDDVSIVCARKYEIVRMT